jgi:hypothetical protein
VSNQNIKLDNGCNTKQRHPHQPGIVPQQEGVKGYILEAAANVKIDSSNGPRRRLRAVRRKPWNTPQM